MFPHSPWLLQTGKFQQTIANCIEKTGKALHSGNLTAVKILPEFAGEGRFFDFDSKFIPASIDFAQESPLCTKLCKDGYTVQTVEHLLSALEATGVDNCRIEITNLGRKDRFAEVMSKLMLLIFKVHRISIRIVFPVNCVVL